LSNGKPTPPGHITNDRLNESGYTPGNNASGAESKHAKAKEEECTRGDKKQNVGDNSYWIHIEFFYPSLLSAQRQFKFQTCSDNQLLVPYF
jgi:hypothetical protein